MGAHSNHMTSLVRGELPGAAQSQGLLGEYGCVLLPQQLLHS